MEKTWWENTKRGILSFDHISSTSNSCSEKSFSCIRHSDHTYAYTWLILAVYEKPHVRLHLVNAYSLWKTLDFCGDLVICRPYVKHIAMTQTPHVTRAHLMLWRTRFCEWHITGNDCNLYSPSLLTTKKKSNPCGASLQVQLYASFKRIGCCWLHSAARFIPGSKHGCYYQHSTRCPSWLGGNSVAGSWNIRWRRQALVVPIHKNKQVLERLHGCQLHFQYNRIRCGSTNFCWPIGYRINLSKCYRLLQLLFDHTSALPRLSDSCAICFQFVCFRVVYKGAVMLYVVTSKEMR